MKKYPAILLALLFVAPLQQARCEEAQSIVIDTTKATTDFPHSWEHFFGSGRAILSLRESYRKDLERLKKNHIDVQYVRFHNIFHDEVGFYDEDKSGNPIYNFTYIDQIYDGLIDRGVRPFVELSFMPNKLAASSMPHAFWYHPNVSPPKSYDKWAEMIRVFTQHLVDRYGIDEVSKWYFEVWNEPNLDFWGGKPSEETYYQLYDATARAVKGVNPRLRVGGPATAQAAWAGKFIAHCVDNKVPIDYFSTHVYGNDAPAAIDTDKPTPRADMVALAVRKVHDQVAKSPLPHLPIIWSEYGASYFNEVDITDSEFMGPWLANNISKCDGLATEMSLWTFSDVFEEQGVPKSAFYGGFGLIGPTGIPKAGFNAMAMLSKLGKRRYPVAAENVIATNRGMHDLIVAIWNYVEPGTKGSSHTYKLHLPAGKVGSYWDYRVDANHGSALTKWREMGSPAFPTREQHKVLMKSAELMAPQRRMPTGPNEITVELPPNGLALLEIPDDGWLKLTE
jgi:xylan 1,4-beta-xylosidase